MKVIEVKDLVFRYPGNREEIIKGISFQVEQGSFVAVIGPNGAGKSTLYRLILKELIPNSGVIDVWGKRLSEYRQKELAKIISALPSDEIEDSSLTVDEYLELGRYPHSGIFKSLKKLDYNLIENAKKITDIEKFSRRFLFELSKGELARVRIARTIVQDGGIFLMDEPTAHLDIDHKLWLLSTLRRLKAHLKTIIIILHDVGMAFKYADEILLMDKGEIKYFGKKENLNPGLLEEVFRVKVKMLENNLLFEER